jgi:hypothetical protein
VTTTQPVPAAFAPAAIRTGRARLLAVAGAVAAAVVVWLVAVPIFGVDLMGPEGPGATTLKPIILPAVVVMSLGSSLAGWALLAVLERITSRARTIWTVAAVAVLAVSYSAPLFGAGVPTASRITLAVMHTVVAAVLVPLLRRSSPTR